MAPKTSAKAAPIDSLKHKDKRANIPTEELRDFVAEDEKSPKTILYPRDPSLDPQLVWKGKDEQDRNPLEVPSVPIYIQEKVHPRAIVEDLRARASSPNADEQLSLFGDFNGIEFEDLVEFYQHDVSWSNRMILGDSLLVMTSLAEKEGLKGKVQMIYIDPPYGIRFGSNWQVSTRKRDVKDGKVEDATRQPEQVKAFRDTWELGIHSYLSYLRDRVVVARELLAESGSIFVQIGDENAHLVRCLMDEVFGAENFCGQIIFSKTSSATAEYLATVCDHLLWYARSRPNLKFRPLFFSKPSPFDDEESKYDQARLADGSGRALASQEKTGGTALPMGARPYRLSGIDSQTGGPNTRFPVRFRGADFLPSGTRGWSSSRQGMERLILADRVQSSKTIINFVRFFDDYPYQQVNNVWMDIGGAVQSRSDPKVYVVQTGTAPIQRCVLLTTDPGDLVLDPTCGSGTTAYVAEQWGRRWITIDTSRVALALARTRLMAGRYPYYLLADSPEGATKESELDGLSRPFGMGYGNDVRQGFVYRRVPHVTLKSIANNEEIDTIYYRFMEDMEPLRVGLGRVLNQSWEEWQIPREADATWPAEAKEWYAEWWRLRRERQKEIDASIARRADTEVLYDQPYEDSKRVRVSGPFTVESLSPHRVVSADEERPASEGKAQQGVTAGQFETMIMDNLRKAGVQNTKKNERLKLDRLEPFAGTWLQATGQYTDGDGLTRSVAVSIGPEHGTVGPEQVKEAAKEALRGKGFDVLVVCGFAFDAHAGETAKEFQPEPSGKATGFAVAEESRRYGKLPVLLARINPDLAMGDELLKKTGAGNLFTVFGEPDVEIRKQVDGKLVVEVRGVDVYDPTTGQIRSSSTDDIACWFIDTDYNEESFFVRHAYFTGAGDPYEKLKRALRAEIDEAAWASLYSTVSRPFDPPKSRKIAVKVINHYGDEVLKVFGAK